MAEQDAPVRRRVAIKLIKAGMDSRQIIARFDAERQALALMDHAGIAKVFDAGTDNGRPFFVMELVPGLPLTRYCDENRVSMRERLELFIAICQAIQHAHQKGVIHRDLKPSNILVTVGDGNPLPKIIDFGMAKALQHAGRLTDKSYFTEFGLAIGTPQYMSPEQTETSLQDIDTRSDIYSLGVILYELLTGTTPLDSETIKKHALVKVLEIVRDAVPPPPSRRLGSSSSQVLESVSGLRRIESKKLTTLLRGELDWIVMKALDKDRSRRYDTVNSFARDVQRYLNSEPIDARPPTTAYLLRKFVARHRGLVASTVAMILLLCAGVIATTLAMFRASRAEQLAQGRLVDATRAQQESKSAELKAKASATAEKLARRRRRHV